MVMCAARPRARSGAAAMLLGAAVALHAPVVAAQSAPAVKLGIVTFLSGPAAGPFGIPARNAAELTIEAINKGEMPAPYDSKGLAGAQIEALYVDEAGPASKGVQDFRDLVGRRGGDAVVGYVSSGSCLGIAPGAGGVKKLTVFFDCGTPRVFRDASSPHPFRPTP